MFTEIWCLLKHVRLASGWYTSYWKFECFLVNDWLHHDCMATQSWKQNHTAVCPGLWHTQLWVHFLGSVATQMARVYFWSYSLFNWRSFYLLFALAQKKFCNILTGWKQSCGEVMFSQASVCHSVHVTVKHDEYDFTIPNRLSLIFTSSGHHWSFVQTCSVEDLIPLWYWHLVEATGTKGVCKRAVRILLECFLVKSVIKWAKVGWIFSYVDFIPLCPFWWEKKEIWTRLWCVWSCI